MTTSVGSIPLSTSIKPGEMIISCRSILILALLVAVSCRISHAYEVNKSPGGQIRGLRIQKSQREQRRQLSVIKTQVNEGKGGVAVDLGDAKKTDFYEFDVDGTSTTTSHPEPLSTSPTLPSAPPSESDSRTTEEAVSAKEQEKEPSPAPTAGSDFLPEEDVAASQREPNTQATLETGTGGDDAQVSVRIQVFTGKERRDEVAKREEIHVLS